MCDRCSLNAYRHSSELNAKHESKPLSRNQFTRQKLAIEVLAKSKPVSQIAAEHQVSRKFLYHQGHKAKMALNESFESTAANNEVLFYLPITQTWLLQMILGLVLICHCSYRGVVELLRDLFDLANGLQIIVAIIAKFVVPVLPKNAHLNHAQGAL